jgi:hypothetical protein
MALRTKRRGQARVGSRGTNKKAVSIEEQTTMHAFNYSLVVISIIAILIG